MPSKILFLGTGAGAVAQQQLRASGGMVVQASGYQFIIDPGPGSLVRAKQYGINLRLTTALLLSHAHTLHTNDANAIIGAMTHNGLDRKGVIIANSTCIRGTKEMIPVITPFHQQCVERVIIPEPAQKIGIENVEIHALKAHHHDPHALGFKIFTEDFVLTYTGDTGYNREVIEQYRQSDIIIFNMPNKEKSDGHNLNQDFVTRILKLIQPRLAIITHFGQKVYNDDPLVIARNIYKATNVQTIAANDGLLLTPQFYAAELKHKTLNLYPSEKAQEFKESTEEAHTQQDSQASETASQDKIDLSYL